MPPGASDGRAREDDWAGAALRRAALQGHLGATDLVYVAKETKSKPTPLDVSKYATMVAEALRKAPEAGGFVETRESKPAETEGFVLVWKIAPLDAGDDDGFGAETDAPKERREVGHSFVNTKTGLVYLVGGMDETGRHQPGLEFGPRCSVLDPASCRRALSETTGMLRQFQGGLHELLTMGVDVDACNGWGETALMLVAGSLETDDACGVMELLLSRGASPNRATTAFGCTALLKAVEETEDDEATHRCEVLISRGARLDTVNKWGVSALWLATCRGLKSTRELLLSRGAPSDVRTINGLSSRDVAPLAASSSS